MEKRKLESGMKEKAFSSEKKQKSTTLSSKNTQLIQAAEEFVKKEMKENDGSHDWFHVDRVRQLALALAEEEQIADKDVIELAALFHDIKDWKYGGSESAGVDATRAFLEAHQYPQEKLERVLKIIANIGFKTELGKLENSSKKSVSGDEESIFFS